MAAAPRPIPAPAADVRARALVVGEGAGVIEASGLLRGGGLGVQALSSSGDPLALGSDPQVVVLITRPEDNSADRIATVRARLPHAAIVAVMPEAPGSATLRRALRAGAVGLVPADRLATALLPTVHAVVAGMIVVPPAIRRQLAAGALSHREKQILRLLVRGYTNRQIARELFVAESTVKTHLSSAFGKLGTRSRAEAAALIMDPEEGGSLGILIDPSSSEDPSGGTR